MLRENVVLQELRVNAKGECCSARTEGECRVNAILQELRANAEGEWCSARAEGECTRDIRR